MLQLDPLGGRVWRRAGLLVVIDVFENSTEGILLKVAHLTETVDAAAAVPGQAQIRMLCNLNDVASGTQVVFTTVHTIPGITSKSWSVTLALNAVLRVKRYFRLNEVTEVNRGGSMY